MTCSEGAYLLNDLQVATKMLCNAIHIKEYEINNSIIILSSYAWTVMLPPRRLTIVCMQLPYKDPCDFPGYEGTCFSVVGSQSVCGKTKLVISFQSCLRLFKQ